MPGEDKLTHAQRIRLEAFAQACGTQYVIPFRAPADPNNVARLIEKPLTMALIFERAEQIEAWLWAAKGGA